jgi:hypothetical protein
MCEDKRDVAAYNRQLAEKLKAGRKTFLDVAPEPRKLTHRERQNVAERVVALHKLEDNDRR